MVDGTVYVGYRDNNLYALDTDSNGSSEGSRVTLGTLGHHNNWDYAGQSIKIDDSVPGFGIGSGITALGAVIYMLKQRLTDESE